MSEVRIDLDDRRVFRVLVGFGEDDRPALLLAGNKAGLGNAWYQKNVPVADNRFDDYLTAVKQANEKQR